MAIVSIDLLLIVIKSYLLWAIIYITTIALSVLKIIMLTSFCDIFYIFVALVMII